MEAEVPQGLRAVIFYGFKTGLGYDVWGQRSRQLDRKDEYGKTARMNVV